MIDQRRQRGAVMVYVIIALIAFFGLAALATDGGFAWNTRGQVQNAADGAALAAAGELIKNNGLTLDKPGALAAAQLVSQASEVLFMNGQSDAFRQTTKDDQQRPLHHPLSIRGIMKMR